MVVVQIESETYPGEFCYLMEIAPNVWTRHLNIASSFRNRASAIMAIEMTRLQIMKDETSSKRTLSFSDRLRFANILSVDEVDDDICIVENKC